MFREQGVATGMKSVCESLARLLESSQSWNSRIKEQAGSWTCLHIAQLHDYERSVYGDSFQMTAGPRLHGEVVLGPVRCSMCRH